MELMNLVVLMDGDLLVGEEFGNTLILDGTDSDGTDDCGGFLLDDETGDGNILLDALQDGVDVGSNVINETGIDYNLGVTVTDSSGVSGKVVYVNWIKDNIKCWGCIN